MSHRSKRQTLMRRCKVCGMPTYYFVGNWAEHCPYKALHTASNAV